MSWLVCCCWPAPSSCFSLWLRIPHSIPLWTRPAVIYRAAPRITGLACWALGLAICCCRQRVFRRFLVPLLVGGLGWIWLRSRPVGSPVSKLIGGMLCLIFVPTLLGLLPGHMRWLHTIPIEGIIGGAFSELLTHYLNYPGACVLSMALVAAALYHDHHLQRRQPAQLAYRSVCVSRRLARSLA